MGGGSLQVWKNFLGPHSKIVGIDINKDCFYQEPQIHVEIGNQSDEFFIADLIEKYGVPDILIDDGGHQQNCVKKTFELLYPQMDKNSVYIVEDVHAAYLRGFGGSVFTDFVKQLLDELHGKFCGKCSEFTFTTRSVNFYDSVIVFEKGDNYGFPDRNIIEDPWAEYGEKTLKQL